MCTVGQWRRSRGEAGPDIHAALRGASTITPGICLVRPQFVSWQAAWRSQVLP